MIETIIIMIFAAVFGYGALDSLAKEGKTGCASFVFILIIALIIYFLIIGQGAVIFIVIPTILGVIFFIKIFMDIFK